MINFETMSEQHSPRERNQVGDIEILLKYICQLEATIPILYQKPVINARIIYDRTQCWQQL